MAAAGEKAAAASRLMAAMRPAKGMVGTLKPFAPAASRCFRRALRQPEQTIARSKIVHETAALRHFNPAYVAVGVTTGYSAMSAQLLGLPERWGNRPAACG